MVSARNQEYPWPTHHRPSLPGTHEVPHDSYRSHVPLARALPPRSCRRARSNHRLSDGSRPLHHNWANSQTARAQEVTGLDDDSDVIDYLAGPNSQFTTTKTPGIAKSANVVLKNVTYADAAEFWSWYQRVKLNTVERSNLTIALLDDSGEPSMVWTVTNATPVKVSPVDPKTDGQATKVASVEMAHEGLIAAPPAR